MFIFVKGGGTTTLLHWHLYQKYLESTNRLINFSTTYTTDSTNQKYLQHTKTFGTIFKQNNYQNWKIQKDKERHKASSVQRAETTQHEALIIIHLTFQDNNDTKGRN